MVYEIETINLNRAETGDLLKDPLSPIYVSPYDRVLVVGIGAIKFLKGHLDYGILPMDPSFVILANHLTFGKGYIIGIDLESNGVHGCINDLAGVSEKMAYWDVLGAKFSEYSFVIGNILDPPPDLGKFDTIIDHISWPYIDAGDGDDDSLPKLARIYKSLLNEGGKAICYIDVPDSKQIDELVESLSGEDLACTKYVGLNDIYEVTDAVILQDLSEYKWDISYTKARYDKLFINDGHLIPWRVAKGFIVAQR